MIQVHSFQRHPLTLDLDAPPGSISRTAVQRAISKNETLDFECDTYANGKLERRNTLKIAFDSSSESEFIEELIGNGEAKFVTRNQLNAFSQELYERLSIEEEYEMPQSIFSDAFVTEFIRFGSAYGFRQEPIKDALQILSQYATDTTQDLSPDTIIRDLGSIFMVENVANERRVVVNKGILDKLRQKYGSSSSGSGSVEASALGLLSSRTSIAASVSQNSKHDRHYQNRSLLDELNKLNSKIANQVSFEIEGNRVIPKTLNVAKMVRTKLSRIFHLRRVRKEQYSAPYFERLHIHYNDQAAVKFKSQMLIVVKQMLDESGAQVKAQCSNLLTEKTNELLVSINENRRIVNDIISYPLNRIRRNEAKIESVITFFRNKTIMTGFHMHYYDDDPEIGPTHKHDDLRQDNIAKFGRWWKRHYLKFQFSVMNATDFL